MTRIRCPARCELEAETVSSLNHPHICTLQDVGSEDDTDYLVMELIEDFPACAFPGDGAGGNLGIGFLGRFDLISDHPHGRLLLKPGPRSGGPFEHNMAGLSLEMQRDGFLLVRRVAAGSPGDEAGLARGNLIVAIDDQDLARGTTDDHAGRFQRDGVSVKVKAEMAGSHYDRTLTLKSLI